MGNYGHILNSFPLRMRLGCYPRLFYPLYNLIPINRQLGVNKKTQLVIDGFPRSANTFAVLAFEQAQENKVSIAHHMHVPAQIIRAAEYRIPSLVLIRNPKDAVASYVMKRPKLKISDAIKSYTRFYKVVQKYSDSYVMATFEEVTMDFAEVVNRLNLKFGTEFVAKTPKEYALESIFNRAEDIAKRNGVSELGVSRPSEIRKKHKQEVLQEITSSKNREILIEAENIYLELTSH